MQYPNLLHIYLPLALFSAGFAMADTPLNGPAFDALVTGNTLTFSAEGGAFGTEYYAPNQRVIWAFAGQDDCLNGRWYEKPSPTGPQICFTYENDPTPKCWHVYSENGVIRADYMTQPGTTVLFEVTESTPLVCGGPGV